MVILNNGENLQKNKILLLLLFYFISGIFDSIDFVLFCDNGHYDQVS